MAENNDLRADQESIVSKIEAQLAEILAKKKAGVNQLLEEKIRQEQEEAKKKLQEIEHEYAQEKESLSTYRTLVAEFETKRLNLREEIKSHLEKAMSSQNEIASLTSRTLEELRSVSQMNQELEDYKNSAKDKLFALKKDLEDKYGITTQIPQEDHRLNMDLDLEKELSKLTKIKELLKNQKSESYQSQEDMEAEELPEQSGNLEPPTESQASSLFTNEDSPSVPEPPVTPSDLETEAATMPEPATEPKIEPIPEPVPGPPIDKPEKETNINLEQPGSDAGSEQEYELEVSSPEIDDSPKIELAPEPEVEFETPPQSIESGQPVEENDLNELQNLNEMKNGADFDQVFEALEKFRKGACTEDNGDVSYFQKDEQIIIDGECLISTLNNSLEGAKKLYAQLEKAESPKEQFFIKQDIIRHQEVLRKLMLVAIRMYEKESCSLPEYTKEILNVDSLKSMLEKVSMGNWSDSDDFASFDKYAGSLKDAYYAKITPPARYLDSILNELEVKQP